MRAHPKFSLGFGELFISIRKELSLTQVELSKLLKLGQSTLSKIEAGTRVPTVDVYLRLKHTVCVTESTSKMILDFEESTKGAK